MQLTGVLSRPRIRIAVAVILVLISAGLRFEGLGRISVPYWDETFYVADASAYAGLSPAQLRPNHPVPSIREGTWMQPPLAKWAMVGGEELLGHTPWGWRAPSALFGSAAVLATYMLGLELFASVALAALAGLLVALDGLEIVQSRLGTPDVFAATLALAGVSLLVRLRSRPPTRLGLGAAGALLGAAVAAKWSALPFLFGGAAWAWWLVRRAPDGRRRTAGVEWILAFLVVPTIVYLVSYASFFTQNGPDVVGFLRLQWHMLAYGLSFNPGSQAASSPWSWLVGGGSINYTQAAFYGAGIRLIGGNVDVIRVLAVGNPVLTWAFLTATPALVWAAARYRSEAEAVVAAGFLAAWLPWAIVARTEFLYYLLPAVPFMALGVAAAVGRLSRVAAGAARPVAMAAGGGLAAAAGTAAWTYYPLWTALPVGFYTFARLTHLPGVH